MHSYAKLKDGRVMVIMSENSRMETMRGYDIMKGLGSRMIEWSYNDIETIDSNLNYLLR